MTALTVFLAPDGPACGVRDVLTDLSAAGLVREFVWVVDADVAVEGGAPDDAPDDVPAEVVAGGVATATLLGAVLADRRHDRRRLCVVVPVADGAVVAPAVEQRLQEIICHTGTPVRTALVRAVVARPGDRTEPEVLRRDGWHNVYVAPEDARGPALPAQLLPRDAHPVELGRLAGPAVAGLVGLWTGIDATPLDDPQAPDGVRAARAFYRRIDADEVEQELRHRVLSTRAPLPEPADQAGRAVYLPDPAEACGRVVATWWERHRPALVGPRRRPEEAPEEAVGLLDLLKVFLAFVWSGLRGAPHDLLRGAALSGAAAAARRLHQLAFGAGEAAYTVVAAGVDRDGMPVGWRELGAATGELDRRLADGGLPGRAERPDLGTMWRQFTDGALTLVDAGRRTLPGPQVGPHPGVVRATADVAPPPGADFVVRGQLHNDVGERVVVGDVLGAAVLRRQLEHLRTGAVRPVDASATRTALGAWEDEHRHRYTVQAGRALAATLDEVVGEVRHHLGWLRTASQEEARDDRLPRRSVWTARLLAFVALAGLVAGPVLGVRGVVPVRVAVAVGLVPLAVWLAHVLVGYVRTRRDLFRALHRRQTLVTELDAVRANLRQATIDAARLAEAYDQYLVWSRVLGAVLERPFGGPPPPAPARPGITSGLPRTTRLAHARVDDDATAAATAVLRRDVFSTGWLGRLWSVHLAGAGRQLGSFALDDRPESLFDLRGGVADSPLRAWADLLARSGTASTAGDRRWAEVRDSLRTVLEPLGTALLSSVREVGAGSPTGLAKFLVGVDRRAADAGQELAAAHFTARARAAQRGRVDVHWLAPERVGLSRVDVLLQLTEACDPWDFAVAAPPAGPDDTRHDPPPGYPHAPHGNGQATPRAGERHAVPEAPPGYH